MCGAVCYIIHMDVELHVHFSLLYNLDSMFIGGITISDAVTFSDLNGASPQFTLTCISTGGPATTVTWTRGSEMLTGSTVLDNAETAQYTHTLTVTGRLGGLYTCTVANAISPQDSAQLNVQGTCYIYLSSRPCPIYVCILICGGGKREKQERPGWNNHMMPGKQEVVGLNPIGGAEFSIFLSFLSNSFTLF